MTPAQINHLNSFLMLLSAGLAYTLPFELVLLSYAFLGPAHYLTQISWLHDRQYFSAGKFDYVPLVLLTILLLVLPIHLHPFIYVLGLGLALSLVVSSYLRQRLFVLLPLTVFCCLAVYTWPKAGSTLAILIPTVVHVFIFTGAFIMVGTLKGKSISGWISLAVFLACGISFFIWPPINEIKLGYATAQNLGFFSAISDTLRNVLALPHTEATARAAMGFLSYAYTYHYLNWFSKTGIIGWHKMPRKRLGLIICAYLFSIGLYIIDYRIGFGLLLFLSLLHVLLEFPLNWRTFHMIGQAIRK